jgi:hypothetical protein
MNFVGTKNQCGTGTYEYFVLPQTEWQTALNKSNCAPTAENLTMIRPFVADATNCQIVEELQVPGNVTVSCFEQLKTSKSTLNN